MHKILVIRPYFPLAALHVSDYVSPSSGAIFYELYIAFAVTTQQPDVSACTKCDVQLIKDCF